MLGDFAFIVGITRIGDAPRRRVAQKFNRVILVDAVEPFRITIGVISPVAATAGGAVVDGFAIYLPPIGHRITISRVVNRTAPRCRGRVAIDNLAAPAVVSLLQVDL